MVKISINPPPRDMKCQRCGKHVDELKPFGGPGDPLVGDFTGAKLVKTFRPGCEDKMPALDKVIDRFNVLYEADPSTAKEKTIEEFGEELAEEAFFYDQLYNTVIADLFRENGHPPIRILKWKEVYQGLEDACDHCKDYSHVIGNLLVKNS